MFSSFPIRSFLLLSPSLLFFFFFFNDTSTTEIYTLSLHDALPISRHSWSGPKPGLLRHARVHHPRLESRPLSHGRSEEHTSELQSRVDLVCRLLLEKKKKTKHTEDNRPDDNHTIVQHTTPQLDPYN